LRDVGSIVFSSCGLVYFIYLVVTRSYGGSDSLADHWLLIVLAFVNLGWFLLELATMFTNSKRRAFHDLIANTVVVRVD
jgi:hypothetical protein